MHIDIGVVHGAGSGGYFVGGGGEGLGGRGEGGGVGVFFVFLWEVLFEDEGIRFHGTGPNTSRLLVEFLLQLGRQHLSKTNLRSWSVGLCPIFLFSRWWLVIVGQEDFFLKSDPCLNRLTYLRLLHNHSLIMFDFILAEKRVLQIPLLQILFVFTFPHIPVQSIRIGLALRYNIILRIRANRAIQSLSPPLTSDA